MSVVAVKVYPNKVVMAADSFVGFGWTSQLKDKDVKIFRQNGMVVGCVGYAQSIALFKIYCRDRKPARDDEDAIIDFVAEFVKWAKDKVDSYIHESDFMIIYKHKAWLIDSSFYYKQITDYASMGAGQDMAQTALYLGKSPKEAVEAACELSIYCELPVAVYEVPA